MSSKPPSSTSPQENNRASVLDADIDAFWDNTIYPQITKSAKEQLNSRYDFHAKKRVPRDWGGLTPPNSTDIANEACERLFDPQKNRTEEWKLQDLDATLTTNPQSIEPQIIAELKRLIDLEIDKHGPKRRKENTKHFSSLNQTHLNEVESQHSDSDVKVIHENHSSCPSPDREIEIRIDIQAFLEACDDPEVRALMEWNLRNGVGRGDAKQLAHIWSLPESRIRAIQAKLKDQWKQWREIGETAA